MLRQVLYVKVFLNLQNALVFLNVLLPSRFYQEARVMVSVSWKSIDNFQSSTVLNTAKKDHFVEIQFRNCFSKSLAVFFPQSSRMVLKVPEFPQCDDFSNRLSIDQKN